MPAAVDHQKALAHARRVLAESSFGPIRELARAYVELRTREIEQRKLLAEAALSCVNDAAAQIREYLGRTARG